jgi:adenine-specific DNA-methyltransferase
MEDLQKIEFKSKDIKCEQVEKLKKIFPEIVADGKINFEQLKATLGEEIEDSKERFGMTWAGKSKCFRIIQDPSTGTLKPSREESVNFDTTQNLFIEGDNLEVLKLLQKSYYEKVKMIYIDPPYNTGNDFVYPDNFGQQLEEYLKLTGQVDSDGEKTFN